MKYNAHTIQSFFNDVRQYLDWAFYTNLVLDSASFMTKFKLLVFSKDKDLRELAKASMKEDIEEWHPISGPFYAIRILSQKSPDYETDPGCACDVIDYAPKWLLRKHYEELYMYAPDIHRIWLRNRLGYGIGPEERLPAVRKFVRDVARTRNTGNPLSISPYEDGHYYPSCNDFSGLGNLLAAIVGNGGLPELKLYIKFNEHVISKYTRTDKFKEMGTDSQYAIEAFWKALDYDIQLMTESFLEDELTSFLRDPLPEEIKLFCSRPKEPLENGFQELLYSEEKIPDHADEDMIDDWQNRAAGEEALAMNQLGIIQLLFPEIDTEDSPTGWFEKAAEMEYAPAKLNYATYLSSKDDYDWRFVCDLLIEAYKEGVYQAMYKLCHLSLFKISSESPVFELVMDMLKKLAPVEIMSSFLLAEAYYQGIFVSKDDEKAFEYALIIANHSGAVYAYQYRVGYMYQKGIGTEQDTDKALEWFRKALSNPLCTEEFRVKAEQGIADIRSSNQIIKDN